MPTDSIIDRMLERGELVPYIDALFAESEYRKLTDDGRWERARREVRSFTAGRWQPSADLLQATYTRIKNGEWE